MVAAGLESTANGTQLPRACGRAAAGLAREDRELAIVCPPGPVRRLFEVVGIADLLFFYASREDAAAALVPAD